MKKRTLHNSTTNNYSRFVSLKTNSIQTTDSLLELDACFHFEFAPDINSFEAQPLGYQYQLNGKARKYTPDFLCDFDNGNSIFFEVKPKAKTLSEAFQEKFQAQKIAAQQVGKDLELITDEQIRIYPLLDNLKIIHRYACFDELDDLQLSILALFQSHGELRVDQILRRSNESSAIILPALYDLVAKRKLNINWHKPINEYTLISVAP